MPERFNAQEDAFIEASERRRRLYRNLWIAGPCLIIAGLSALTGLAVRETKRADSEAATVKQWLLASDVEQGRQLLVEKDNPAKRVCGCTAPTQGSTSTVLPYYLPGAPRCQRKRRARP